MPQYVGLLHSGLKAPVKDQVTALKNKLGGVTLTETYADNKVETLEDNAEAFVGDPDCRVIIAAGGTLAAVVAQQVTERQDDNPRNRKPVIFIHWPSGPFISARIVASLQAASDSPGGPT